MAQPVLLTKSPGLLLAGAGGGHAQPVSSLFVFSSYRFVTLNREYETAGQLACLWTHSLYLAVLGHECEGLRTRIPLYLLLTEAAAYSKAHIRFGYNVSF